MKLKQIVKKAGFKDIGQFWQISGISPDYAYRLWQTDEKAMEELAQVYAPYIPCESLLDEPVVMEANGITIFCKRREMARVMAGAGFTRGQIIATFLAGHVAPALVYAELKATTAVDGWDVLPC